MNSKEVAPVPQRCTFCGAGPYHPREDRTFDRFTRQTIIEALWVCGNCGNLFDKGMIRVEKEDSHGKQKT